MTISTNILGSIFPGTNDTFTVLLVTLFTIVFLYHNRKSSRDSKYWHPPSPPPGSKFVRISNGIKIRYEEHIPLGSSNELVEEVTIVLIHGFLGCLETWNLLIPLLLTAPSKSKFSIKKIISLDLVGFGYSDKPKNFTYSHRQQGDAVYELLEKLHVTNAVLVGHSSGTIIASRVASIDSSSSNLKNTDGSTVKKRRVSFINKSRVKGLILLSAGGLFQEKKNYFSWKIMYPLCKFIAKKLLQNRRSSLKKFHQDHHPLDETMIRHFVAPSRLSLDGNENNTDNNENNVDEKKKKKDIIDKNAIEVVARTIHVEEEPYATMLIDEIHPSLFIHIIFGDNDTIFPNNEKNGPIIDRVLSSLRNKYSVNDVCDSDHYIQHEQPEQLAKLIFDLLEDGI
mmetsp:Transcript_40537/g.59277  ORF Transcript_40537/g.59277 Transcript_40537/m.59277 type:complete len:396 (-) Transcript_40537:399-1586(-)